MNARAGLAATLFILAVGAAPRSSCPAVYQVGGGHDPKTAYNVLFLGAGFSKCELPTFRKAVLELTSQVVAHPSLAPYRRWINIYRMDLVGESGVDVQRCPSRCCARTPLPAAIEGSVPTGTLLPNQGILEFSPTVDLVARRCWLPPGSQEEHGNCNLIWLDAADRARVLGLQFCAPNIHAVVVVANLNDIVGGGLEDALSAGVGLTVIGASSSEEDGYSVAGPWAAALLEHEFGHLFGLYDEYVSAEGEPRASFHADRNVWRPIAPNEMEDVLSDPTFDYETCKDWDRTGNIAPPIPWQDTLDRCCPTAGIDTCTSGTHPRVDSCVWSPFSPLESCDLASRPGLWEGAYYREQCFYRARSSCLMQLASPEESLCEACLGQIHRVLCGYLPQVCSRKPSLPRCWNPPEPAPAMEQPPSAP